MNRKAAVRAISVGWRGKASRQNGVRGEMFRGMGQARSGARRRSAPSLPGEGKCRRKNEKCRRRIANGGTRIGGEHPQKRTKRSGFMASNLRFVWAGRSWGRGGNLLSTMAPTRGPKRQSKGGVLKALCVHAHFDDFEFVAAVAFEFWRARVGRGF